MDEKPLDLLPVLKIAAFFLTFIVIVLISLPFLSGTQIFRGHDTFFYMLLFRSFGQALFEGQIPVRVVQGAFPGLDAPAFNYYQSVFFYLASLPKMFSLSNVWSLNLTVLGLWFASGGFMFAFARKHFGSIPALVSSVFYVLAPYHISQVLVRAALTEFTVMAFVPAVFYTLDLLFEKQTGKRLFFASLTTAIFLLSHHIMAVIFFPIIFLYIFLLFWKKQQKKALLLGLLSFGLAFGLSAFFFIPALGEGSYVHLSEIKTGSADFHIHFVCLNQLFNSEWDYGASVPGCEDGMSFQVGILHWFAILIASVVLAMKIRKIESVKLHCLTIFFLLVFLFSVFMTLEVSLPFWESVGPLTYFQFPWRYLGLAVFSSAFLIGAVISLVKKEINRYLLGLIAIAMAIFFYGSLAKPSYFYKEAYFNFNGNFLYNLKDSGEVREYFEKIWAFNSTWEKVRPDNLLNLPASEAAVLEGSAEIRNFSLTSTQKNYQIKTSEKSLIRFYTHYFPLWKVFINGKETEFTIEKDLGYILVEIPQGEHSVELILLDTDLRMQANRVTVAAFILLTALSLGFAKLRNLV